jgi:hypothetical protein
VKFSEHWKLDIPELVVQLNSVGLRRLKLHSVAWLERSRNFIRSHCACGFRTAWCRVESDAHVALGHHIDSAEHLQSSREVEAAIGGYG